MGADEEILQNPGSPATLLAIFPPNTACQEAGGPAKTLHLGSSEGDSLAPLKGTA